MERQPLWQADFPIPRDLESQTSRRQFLKFLGLSSLALCAGTASMAARGALRDGAPPPPELEIPGGAELAPGAALTFHYPDEHSPAILVRLDEETFVAYDQRCTHLQCPVLYMAGSNRLDCPCHEGAFDLATGRVLAGPPPRPLSRIVLERRGSAIVAVGLEHPAGIFTGGEA